MLGLSDIINGLLFESVSEDEVLDAIRNKYFVKIRYNDEQGGPTGYRTIQPMAIGTTKKGYPVVRAFQNSGSSKRGAPKWKYFRLDRVSKWMPMRNKHFYAPPDDAYGVYNTAGDRSMGSFVDNAKFDTFTSPLERTRAQGMTRMNAPKIGMQHPTQTQQVQTASQQTPASQQWKRNVYTSQPNSQYYANVARNIDQTQGETNRFDDDVWARAEAERDQQNAQNNNDYEIDYTDFNPEDFEENQNRR